MHALLAVLLVATLSPTVEAQRGDRPDRPGRPPGPGLVEPRDGERIAWYGTLDAGLAEAKRLNRPILLLSAAPHCHQIPGVW